MTPIYATAWKVTFGSEISTITFPGGLEFKTTNITRSISFGQVKVNEFLGTCNFQYTERGVSWKGDGEGNISVPMARVTIGECWIERPKLQGDLGQDLVKGWGMDGQDVYKRTMQHIWDWSLSNLETQRILWYKRLNDPNRDIEEGICTAVCQAFNQCIENIQK